jgi:hypothetical protein
MFGLCKYKHLFGEPNTGLRVYRIGGIAIMDTAVVIGIGYLISKYLQWNLGYTLGGLFILGIIAHRLFCVRTGLDKILFPSEDNFKRENTFVSFVDLKNTLKKNII